MMLKEVASEKELKEKQIKEIDFYTNFTLNMKKTVQIKPKPSLVFCQVCPMCLGRGIIFECADCPDYKPNTQCQICERAIVCTLCHGEGIVKYIKAKDH